ncbi:isoprenyl transferase [Thermosulfuriphilus sp.]
MPLRPDKIPEHVAIIMDGNGRWAQRRGLPRIAGHREGLESVRAIVREARQIGIKVLTLYAFSKENWKRPRREVAALMGLLRFYLKRELPELKKQSIKLMAIGEVELLPPKAYRALQEAMEETAQGRGMILNLALSYGGRSEIALAARRIAKACLEGKIQPEDVDESLFASYLYTAQLPDPDLIIRTSGEMRLSNFLLYQSAYSELYITPVLWPEFREKEFLEALEEYQGRERRFGLTSEQIKCIEPE